MGVREMRAPGIFPYREDFVEGKLKRVLSSVFEMDEDEIHENLAPDHVPLWDSLHHLKMVTEIEGIYRIKLSMKEIRTMTTFGRIREVVESRLAGTDAQETEHRANGMLKQS
jgi:acyl carrier protein